MCLLPADVEGVADLDFEDDRVWRFSESAMGNEQEWLDLESEGALLLNT